MLTFEELSQSPCGARIETRGCSSRKRKYPSSPVKSLNEAPGGPGASSGTPAAVARAHGAALLSAPQSPKGEPKGENRGSHIETG